MEFNAFTKFDMLCTQYNVTRAQVPASPICFFTCSKLSHTAIAFWAYTISGFWKLALCSFLHEELWIMSPWSFPHGLNMVYYSWMKLLHSLVLCSIQGDGINKQSLNSLPHFLLLLHGPHFCKISLGAQNYMIQFISYFIGHLISRVQIFLHFI